MAEQMTISQATAPTVFGAALHSLDEEHGTRTTFSIVECIERAGRWTVVVAVGARKLRRAALHRATLADCALAIHRAQHGAR